MRIRKVDYTHKYRSLDVYVAGCSAEPKCDGCHNPSLWDFKNGEPYTHSYFDWHIAGQCAEFKALIERIMVFGGDLLDQDPEFIDKLMFDLSKTGLPVWVFTRKDLSEVPESVLRRASYIKCGRFVKDLKCKGNIQHGIELATSNQRIYVRGEDY